MSKKKLIGNIILLLAIVVLVFVIIFQLNDIKEIGQVLASANIKYILIALALLAAYLIIWPITLVILMRAREQKISAGHVYIVGFTEHFFSGVTPFSTGGQPFEVYALSQRGVKARESTGVLLMNFITYMISTNLFAAISLIFYKEFTAGMQNFTVIAIVGFTVNFLVLALIIAFGASKGLCRGIIKLVNALCKIKWINKLIGEKVSELEEYFVGVQEAFRSLVGHKWHTLLCILLNIIKMFFYYAIPYFALKSLFPELGAEYFLYILLGASFAITMVVFLPTPGTTGGVEFALQSILSTVPGVSSAVAASGMILWRGITYFLPMIISFIFYLAYKRGLDRDEKKLKAVKEDGKSEAVLTDGDDKNSSGEAIPEDKNSDKN